MSRRVIVIDECAVEKIARMEECKHKIDHICCNKECSLYERKVTNNECDRCHDYEPENGIVRVYFTSKLG